MTALPSLLDMCDSISSWHQTRDGLVVAAFAISLLSIIIAVTSFILFILGVRKNSVVRNYCFILSTCVLSVYTVKDPVHLYLAK